MGRGGAVSEQNPYRCSDNGCVLLVRGRPRGVGTNGGCHCLSECRDIETRRRVQRGIRWLSDAVAKSTDDEAAR